LVVAPHPDDEVLGAGGAIARFVAEGRDVFVTIVTKGGPPLFEEGFIERGRREALEAHAALGVTKTFFLEGFPAALLDTVPLASLNAGIEEVVDEVEPQLILGPFHGDLHADHRKIAESCMVAARPNGRRRVGAIWAYETLSETNWNAAPITSGFYPNTYLDISSFLHQKLEAMSLFESQIQSFPHERSLGALEALARHRGATVGVEAAEAFVQLRAVY
jgi:LmbE family N-acetylglucosaminyl deacetylase